MTVNTKAPTRGYRALASKIIGIGGMNASGKDMLAKYLSDKYGFLFVSTGDIVREESIKKYGNILRPSLKKTGNNLRASYGSGVLVQMSIKRYKESGCNNGVIIASIRTKGEVDELRKHGGTLLFVDADPKLRYQRIKERQREDDFITYDQFVAQEQAEWHESDNPAEFSVKTVKQMADFIVYNDSDISSFYHSVEHKLGF